MRILPLPPPFPQLNPPYPATAYLPGFLRSRGYDVEQADLGIETALAVFSRAGLDRVFEAIRSRAGAWPEPVEAILLQADAYLDTIDPAIGFLQGRDPSLATRIAAGGVLPGGPRPGARG